MMNRAKLKAELLAGHPDTGPYDANDAIAATQLNVVNRTLPKESMTGSEVMNAIDKAEFLALTADNRRMVWDILHLGNINPYGREAELFVDIFGPGSDTILALQAARVYHVSRVVELSETEGLGLSVAYPGHVQAARAL